MKDPGLFRLYKALLEDAEQIINKSICTRDLSNQGIKEVKEVFEVVSWIKNNDTEYPFSFSVTCKYLNLTPEVVRNTLLKRYEGNRTEFVIQEIGRFS